MKLRQITPEFVDEIPRELDRDKLYVCIRFCAVTHLCACGCNIEINTPLHPTGWTILYNGDSVSLFPSVGNWSENCQSHYWITNNKIHWAAKWSRRKIEQTRIARDRELGLYFGTDTDHRSARSVLKYLPMFKLMRSWLARFINWVLRR